MRIFLQDEQAERVYTTLIKAHQAAIEKATAYSHDISQVDSYLEYVKLRQAELELGLIIHTVRSQMDGNPSAEPLADWEKDLVSGNASQRSDKP